MAYRLPDRFWTTSEGQSQFGLTQKQKLENADRVFTFFTKKGWSKLAICAMLGNMDVESRMNPRAENQTADTYGLVQWHPASKLQLWCIEYDLNWELGTSQCKRIDYEETYNLQWASWSTYTFSEWAREMDETLDEMTTIFMTHYEVAGLGTLEERQQWAQFYYENVKLISDAPLLVVIASQARKHTTLAKRIKSL